MSTPRRLEKQTVVENKYESWILARANIIVPIAYLVLFILIGILIARILGQVCATEANIYYYHLRG